MKSMIKFQIAVAIISIVLFSSMALAHGEQTSFDLALSEILIKQNVTKISQIDCARVSDDDFEMMGDAVMEKMIGNHEVHERMDEMMGGEGSQSLRLMHISIGRNWLGCGSGFQGMMGTNMMPMMMRMMGSYYPGYYSNYDAVLALAILGWVLFGVLFVVLVLAITGKLKIKHRK